MVKQALQQFKSCRVQPLLIVEEQHERVLWPGERGKEAPEHLLEAVLHIHRRQI